MESEYITLAIFLSISLFFSFVCSILEAVLLSITPGFVASQTDEVLGARLEELKKNIDKPLSAILTLNTFAHTIGAAGVGAAAQSIWGASSLTIVSALVTIVILIGSEIIPKTIGAVYWRQLAGVVAVSCQWLMWGLYPAVVVCQMVTRIFRQGEKVSVLSRGDVTQFVTLGYRDGLIREHEKDIIENLMSKEHLLTREIMTPRDRLVSLNEDDAISVVNRDSKAWHVSRIPTYAQGHNTVTGYVLKDEVLVEQISGSSHKKLSALVRDILVVHPETELKELYTKLVSADEHIAVVKDGEDVVGVVTMEDVLEEILGQEIVDESDQARGIFD